ncbi:MAG: hypothetical protein BHV87_10155 [Clostridiales bacterium 36_14]|nr:MAG: hypothetical protein BHV87_10155 [Clostridiales bacterium 36_14]
MKTEAKESIKKILVICFASFLMALNIKSFVRTGGLYPGGATGLALLIQRAADMFLHITIPYTIVNILLNAIPVYIGFRFIGKKFTMYSCLMIVLTSVLTDIIPGYAITYDTLLISILTTGGTDFIAIYLSEKKEIDSWNVVLGINVVILAAAGVLFGWDKALYSIIFQYTSTQVVHILYRKYQHETLFIVTNKATEVYEVISKMSNHGATIMEGEGSYEHQERKIVYSVVSSAQSKSIIREVKKADPHAFVNAIKTEQIAGRFYQKPNE